MGRRSYRTNMQL
uniref:Uncharacterized protein n=1 Tax=Arundo donax TaxID=35708 RepID=A0A0A9AUN3_ARUDO